MCGIAGKINLDGKPVKEEELDAMQKALSHRGPDNHGVYADKNVGFSHSRLSIIDLSESAGQPMSNEDMSVWLVFNGEIYNFGGLRKELLDKGHKFKSDSDSETLVHLYEEEGMEFIHKLNGMFAFSIYDRNKKKVFLVRDRIGIKPVYYYSDNEKFVFASEIKAILTVKDIDKVLDFDALSEYLSLLYIPSPKTAFKKIRKLKPAEYLELDAAKSTFNINKYWDFKPDNKPVSEEEASRKIMGFLADSVKLRLISDVPLGAFLSGGIDSSIIVALMAKASNKPPKTFTVGFSDEPGFDETFYAKKVSEMYNTDHTEIKLKYEDIIDKVPDILDSFDEPFADSSALPTFIVSEATRRYVKVALSGDGGDELFGGYNKYLGMMMQANALLLPRVSGAVARKLLGGGMENFENKIFGKNKRRVKKFIEGLGQNGAERHKSWMTHLSNKEKKQFVNFGIGKENLYGSIEAYYNKFKNDSINKALYADLKLELEGDMLVKVDRMSMLASLEVRVPFLDHVFANEVFSLPGSFKIKKGKRKHILLKAAKSLLPKELYNRPKKGFEVPVGPWFKNNKKFQGLFISCMKTKDKANLVNTDNVIKLFDIHKKTSLDYNRELWGLFVLKWWANKYL